MNILKDSIRFFFVLEISNSSRIIFQETKKMFHRHSSKRAEESLTNNPLWRSQSSVTIFLKDRENPSGSDQTQRLANPSFGEINITMRVTKVVSQQSSDIVMKNVPPEEKQSSLESLNRFSRLKTNFLFLNSSICLKTWKQSTTKKKNIHYN